MRSNKIEFLQYFYQNNNVYNVIVNRNNQIDRFYKDPIVFEPPGDSKIRKKVLMKQKKSIG